MSFLRFSLGTATQPDRHDCSLVLQPTTVTASHSSHDASWDVAQHSPEVVTALHKNRTKERKKEANKSRRKKERNLRSGFFKKPELLFLRTIRSHPHRLLYRSCIRHQRHSTRCRLLAVLLTSIREQNKVARNCRCVCRCSLVCGRSVTRRSLPV